MTARDLIISYTTDRLWFACLAALTLAVMGCIGAAAIQADDHYRAEALINQENLTWKQ